MPEVEDHTGLETGETPSAVPVTADPISFWETLVADPTFILTSPDAPDADAAFESLLEEAQMAIQAPEYFGELVIAEGWPSVTETPATTESFEQWRQKIEIYRAEYLTLVANLEAALPDTSITALELATTLAATLETPALAAAGPADLFGAETPEGSAVITGLAGIIVQTATADAPLSVDAVDPTLPDLITDSFDAVSEAAFVALGGTVTPQEPPAEPEPPQTDEAPAEETPVVDVPVEDPPVTDTPVEDIPAVEEPEPLKTLFGTETDDLIDLDADFQVIDGGEGIDTLRVAAALDSTHIITTANGNLLLTQPVGDGAVVLENVERIAFEDGTLAFDDDGLAGQAYRLYQASFDRTPDVEGLGFWIKLLDSGAIDLTEAAEFFLASDEFAQTYGPSEELADVHYLALLYANVLDRAPDLEGFSFWREAQEQGITRADMLVFFSESKENVAQVAPAIEDGIWYF